MEFDYFYGRDSESFRFIRLPSVLLEDELFKELSIDAKVLYSLYLSRSTLSYKNEWIDEKGRIYIIFTVEETAKSLGCGMKKAVKLIKDLENIGLIEKRRLGQGNPNIIYVKDFMTMFRNDKTRFVKREKLDLSKRQFKNGHIDNSRMGKKTNLELSKEPSNYIENSKIDNNYTSGFAETKKGTFLNVVLSPEQEIILSEKIPNLNDYIERLSAYMKSTGKVYRDHASTIMSWYLKDKREGKASKEKTFTGDPSEYESEWNLNN